MQGAAVLSSPLSVRTAAQCRTCISLVDSSSAETTEIIEPSEAVSPEEVAVLLKSLSAAYKDSKAGGAAVMGSMPPGCRAQLYADIIRATSDAQSKVLFDTVTGLSEALSVCATMNCKAFVKVDGLRGLMDTMIS